MILWLSSEQSQRTQGVLQGRSRKWRSWKWRHLGYIGRQPRSSALQNKRNSTISSTSVLFASGMTISHLTNLRQCSYKSCQKCSSLKKNLKRWRDIHVHVCLWGTEYINFTVIYHNPSKRRSKSLLFMELDELFLGTLHGKRKRLQFKLIFVTLW